MDWTFELVVLPVSDVDRAKAFYAERLGFTVDVDHRAGEDFRVVQLTPPGSACSVTLMRNDSAPGSVRGLHLVVADIDAARAELVGRGVDVSELFHFGANGQQAGPDPGRGDYATFCSFSDPDGNGWLVQEVRSRGKGGPTTDIEFSVDSPQPRALDVHWIHGSPSAKHNTDPDIQVYEYDEHTVILRQNKAINYEAPFMFLLFGNTRCVLIDTGATASAEYFPLRATVDAAIDRWLAAHPRVGTYPLLVLHTHSHGDHTAADAQFADRPDTQVVPAVLDGAWPYFGFDEHPDDIVHVDLGGRILECLATPGHHQAAVTFYDPHTGLLLTGDTVYPGRLYVFDWAAFDRSIDRLIEFCATRPVTHVLGCHIEMTTTPGVDYPMGMIYQPEEPPLELTVDHLRRIRATIDENDHRPGRYVLPDLIITPV